MCGFLTLGVRVFDIFVGVARGPPDEFSTGTLNQMLNFVSRNSRLRPPASQEESVVFLATNPPLLSDVAKQGGVCCKMLKDFPDLLRNKGGFVAKGGGLLQGIPLIFFRSPNYF